ncbi:MAG: hypothetical protein ACK5MY_04530, partial [Jhaorihella sp.]
RSAGPAHHQGGQYWMPIGGQTSMPIDIQSWLKVLKDDKRAIFSAAAHAQKAADFLHGFQAQTEATEGVAA